MSLPGSLVTQRAMGGSCTSSSGRSCASSSPAACFGVHVCFSPPLPSRRSSRRGRCTVRAALSLADVPDQMQAFLPALAAIGADLHSWLPQHMLTLAYEPVVLPCSSMNCGDQIYRSTLDPVLRLEQRLPITPQAVGLLALAIAYLTVSPGVLQGAIDYYLVATWQRLTEDNAYTKDDFVVGRKLASGGFGTVFKGTDAASGLPVIVKKAKEFGQAEVWMNERMMRTAPQAVAQFISAFEEGGGGKPDDLLWLVWRYEGDENLYDIICRKDFPYGMEPLLFGRALAIPKGPERRAVTLQVVMVQLLEALAAAHSTGIVHRDVKPQNLILNMSDGRLKLIDWGAAADLRVGINYVPNEYLLDPRYAPPQQYVMATTTPRAPPLPIAAVLSPVLWRLNKPDRFDMWSVGITMLQMAFPGLRNDNAIIAFSKKLRETYNYDLDAWKAAEGGSKSLAEGFETLGLDGGAGWQLLKGLMRYDPTERLSARAALAHPWFSSLDLSVGSRARPGVAAAMDKAAGQLINGDDRRWLEQGMSREGLTEGRLSEELGLTNKATPMPIGSQTIAWWNNRQVDMSAKVQRKQRGGTGTVEVRSGGGSASSRPGKSGAKAAANKAAKGRSGGGGGGSSNGNGRSGGSGKDGGGGKPKKGLKLSDRIMDIIGARAEY